jgi:MFS family permease
MSASTVRRPHSSPDRRLMLVLLGLYVSQSIPLYLFSAAVPAILREIGVSRTSIGLLSVLALPWIVKFLWAPLVDRYALWQPLGRRRSWIVPLQASIILLVFLLAQFPPAENLAPLFVIGALIAVLSATQDAAADGYAVERLAPTERGIGNAIQGGAVAVGVIGGGLARFCSTTRSAGRARSRSSAWSRCSQHCRSPSCRRSRCRATSRSQCGRRCATSSPVPMPAGR